MTNPAAFSDETRPPAPPWSRTLRWEFPHREPVLAPDAFAVRRVHPAARLPLPAAARGSATYAELSPEGHPTVVAFQVDLEPAETPGAPGVLRARLRWTELQAGDPEHGPDEPGDLPGEGATLEMTAAAAEVWAQCYASTNEGAQKWLCRVLGSRPLFDGLIAMHFLGARAPLFAEELASRALEVEARRDELARNPAARLQLTSALLEALEELRALLMQPEDSFRAEATDDHVPCWDARLASYIERLGQPRLAEELRQKGREAAASPETFWSRWLPGQEPAPGPGLPARSWGPLYRLTYAALALWRTNVRPLLLRARSKPAALLFNVADSVSRVSSPSLRIGPDENGQDAILRLPFPPSRTGKPVAVADLPAMDAGLLDVGRGLRLAGSKLFWPFLEWLVETAHHQALHDAQRADIITCEGGWQAIASRVLEVPPEQVHGDEQTNLRQLARLVANLPIRWSDGAQSSALFLLNEEAAAAGRGRGRATITFKLVDRLLEHEHFRARTRHGSGAGPEQWAGWRLVPLVRPRVLPPLPRSPRDTYGAQALFLRRLWLHLVEHGYQLLREEGIQLDAEQAHAIAVYSMLPERLVEPLLEHLTEQKAIETRGVGRYVPADLTAREFIKEGWTKSRENSERGKTSQRRRRK